MTLRNEFFQQRVGLPPTGGDSRVQRYLQTVADAVNQLPAQSVFSFSDPNSNVSAAIGTLGVNIASGSSVLWIKQVGSGNTGWVQIA